MGTLQLFHVKRYADIVRQLIRSRGLNKVPYTINEHLDFIAKMQLNTSFCVKFENPIDGSNNEF